MTRFKVLLAGLIAAAVQLGWQAAVVATDDPADCQQTADGSVDQCPDIHGLGDEPARRAHHLHGLDQEAIAEHGQPDRIVDEDDDQDRNDNGHSQQDKTNLPDPLVQVGDQRLVVLHVADSDVLAKLFGDLRQ